MARKLIKRIFPDPEWVKRQRSLRFLGSLLHDPNIWHLTRHSVAIAVFIGVFVAFIPLPTQMIIAAGLALLFRANLAISVSLVWITNPLTMTPIFYIAYRVGAAVMGVELANANEIELSIEYLKASLASNWQPFLIGCVLCGLFFGLLSTSLVRLAWRLHVLSRWRQRRQARQQQR